MASAEPLAASVSFTNVSGTLKLVVDAESFLSILLPIVSKCARCKSINGEVNVSSDGPVNVAVTVLDCALLRCVASFESVATT